MLKVSCMQKDNKDESSGVFRVVLIDPECKTLKIMQKLLYRQRGVQIIGAFQGVDESLAFVAQTSPDLIFMDAHQLKSTGRAYLEQIRTLAGNPHIILTSFVSDDAAEALSQKGAFDFLLKPFDPGDMDELIRRLRHFRTLSNR